MKVALVNFVPDPSGKNYLGFNHGLASISASLKLDGHVTRLFTISKSTDNVRALAAFDPDAVFVYLTTHQYRLFLNYQRQVFTPLGVPVFLGGPHATAAPEDTVSIPGVAGICIGEGELSARLLLDRISQKASFDDIPNIWFVRDGAVVKNEIGHCAASLDALPFADRSIFPYQTLLNTRSMDILGFELFLTRGCKYTCTYCINARLKQVIPPKHHLRYRSVDNAIKELEWIIKTYEYQGVIGFQDDIFTLDPKWLATFAKDFRKYIGLPFWCNAHIDHLNEPIIKTLRQAGCFRVQIGIESGNEHLRRSLLGKHFTNQRILEVTRLLKKHHMKTVAYFMIGLPDETEADVLQSIRLCQRMAPDWILISGFCPYPGTRMYADLVANGRLDPTYYKTLPTDTYYAPYLVYDQGGLTQEQLAYYYASFVSLAKQ